MREISFLIKAHLLAARVRKLFISAAMTTGGAVQILRKSLQDAHKTLEFSNDALKRLTGRYPAVQPYRSGPTPERRRSGGGGRMRAWSGDYDAPPASKRRDSVGGKSRLAGRLGPPVWREGGERGEPQQQPERAEREERGRGREEMVREREGGRERGWRGPVGEVEERKRRRRDSEGEDQEIEEEESKPSLQSSVVATTAPPRPKGDPDQDGKSKMRNRRMFGFLMGTLQKFKDSEEASKNTEKEKTRKAIERKLEETEAEEREAVAQEKRELFQKIRSEKIRVSRIRSHLDVVEEFEGWNDHSRKLLGYIQTRNKPPIFYLPAQHNSETTEALKRTTAKTEGVIKERQAEIEAMLAEATAPVEVGVKEEGEVEDEVEGEGEGEMDISRVASVAAGSSVREGGAHGGREGKSGGEASESD